jgi:hypothetical protein
MSQESIYCDVCKKRTLHARKGLNHIPSIVLMAIGATVIYFERWIAMNSGIELLSLSDGHYFVRGVGALMVIISVVVLVRDAVAEFTQKWRCQTCATQNIPGRIVN